MINPPKWALNFLRWYCHEDLLEDLEGDFMEIFRRVTKEKGLHLANLTFIWFVFRSLRWSTIKNGEKLNNTTYDMTRNNFRIALRVLSKNSLATTLNILGLTIGISCFLLLGSFVKQELSFDQFHTKKDRIYRTWLKEDYGEGRIFFNSQTPIRFEQMFEENFPEFQEVVQYTEQNFLVGRGENRINEKVAIISPEFFKVFDFYINSGNSEMPLSDKNGLIISESFANKYFGNQNPEGQLFSLQIGEQIVDFTVAAVMEDIAQESSIQFDLAISTENNKDIFDEETLKAWFSIAPETYVLLNNTASITSVDGKMQDIVLSQMGDKGYGEDPIGRNQYNIGFQRLTDIHLQPEIPLGYGPVANPQYVYILGVIGLLVLVIACINYTTLSVGQSMKRSKEVGMRKVLGARKQNLVYQYLSETLLLSWCSTFIAVFATYLLVPVFNILTNSELNFVLSWSQIPIFLGIGTIIGIMSGMYPAFVLSSYRIMVIISGGKVSTGNLVIRKGLVVFQYMITVFLITTTLVMKKQVNFLQSEDLGYDYETVISAELFADPGADRLSQIIASGMEKGELLKERLKRYPEISGIAMGTHVFGTSGWAHVAYNDDEDIFRRFRLLAVDEHYIDAFNIEVVEGRNFESDNGLDQRQSVILNETAVEYFGLDQPVGDKLPGNNFGEHRIIGIVKDFHFNSLHSRMEPLVIVQNIIPIAQGLSDADFGDSIVPKLVFTYTGSQLTQATEILENEWQAVFPNEQSNYEFLEEKIKAQYESEEQMNRLVVVATVLSIAIAIMGLLGLVILIINNKLKEIGIRKVMGASSFSLFRILARGLSIQLVLAFVLSIPITLWLMNKWLENFAYRISIGPELFLFSALIAFLIAFGVIGFHTLTASKINPVKTLRIE